MVGEVELLHQPQRAGFDREARGETGVSGVEREPLHAQTRRYQQIIEKLRHEACSRRKMKPCRHEVPITVTCLILTPVPAIRGRTPNGCKSACDLALYRPGLTFYTQTLSPAA